jgi:hypothetical protein
MNFLQLTQRLRQECGVAGTGPVTVVGQVGQAKKLVDWINTAWLEIQGKFDTWGFMRLPFTFETVASVGDYDPASTTNTITSSLLTDLRYWHKDTFRCQKKSIGVQDEQWLVEWEYQVFRNTYRFNVQVAGRPVVFAIKPNGKAVMLGQKPDDVYEVMGEYQTIPTSMSLDADVPDMGTSQHLDMLIVYKAMEYYGLFESAPEVLARAEKAGSALMSQLEREQLEQVYLGNPLA